MDTKYFVIPFASGGDIATVPNAAQPDGTVSWLIGYGVDYALDPNADPDAILVERREFNYLLLAITQSLAALQTDFPQWVSSTDNGGTSFPYKNGAVVRYTVDGLLWQSIVAANTATPGSDATKWILFGSEWALTSALVAEVARAEAAEALLAPLNSPVLTGTPTAPTQAPFTSGNLLATCAFVAGAVAYETSRAQIAEALLAPRNSPTFSGSPTAPTASPGTNNTLLATTAFVTGAVAAETNRAENAEALLAPLANPNFSGVPTAPTPDPSSDDTTIPNTAWIRALLAGSGGSLVLRYGTVTIPVGGAYGVGAFTWNAPFPTACVGAVAGCHTNDVGVPTSTGNNWTAIAYSTANNPPGVNGGNIRVDNNEGKIVSQSVTATAIGVGF